MILVSPDGAGPWHRYRSLRPILICASIAALAFGAVRVEAEASPSAGSTPNSTSSAPGKPSGKVDLSRLLALPDSFQRPASLRGGADEQKWRGRFKTIEGNLLEAKEALVSAQEELSQIAAKGGNYAVAAPGSTIAPEDTPLSYKLRQEIRRQRESVDLAEHNLKELSVEADIAGVPKEWRMSEEQDPTAD